jgi:hypothetical protein
MCAGWTRFTVTHVVSIFTHRSHTVLNPMHARVARERIAERIADAERERLTHDARSRAHRQQVSRVRASVLLLPRTNPDTRREA